MAHVLPPSFMLCPLVLPSGHVWLKASRSPYGSLDHNLRKVNAFKAAVACAGEGVEREVSLACPLAFYSVLLSVKGSSRRSTIIAWKQWAFFDVLNALTFCSRTDD